MNKYKFIDEITSDVMFEAYGNDLKEIFENAAEALFSVMCKIEKVGTKEKKKIIVEADNAGELMIEWLQSLIAAVDIDCMFFSRFEIKKISETRLEAVIYGEPVSPDKGGTVVKAVTYHQYEFGKNIEGYFCRVALDI
jgi:SHS2 domain-containing protein